MLSTGNVLKIVTYMFKKYKILVTEITSSTFLNVALDIQIQNNN